jgi:hypothetical protein
VNWEAVYQSVDSETWMTWVKLNCLKSSGELETRIPSTQQLKSRPDNNILEVSRCEILLSGTGSMRPIKPRTDTLTHPENVLYDCTAGSPKGCEPQGDGNPIVVGEATLTHGGWESQLQGEGG